MISISRPPPSPRQQQFKVVQFLDYIGVPEYCDIWSAIFWLSRDYYFTMDVETEVPGGHHRLTLVSGSFLTWPEYLC